MYPIDCQTANFLLSSIKLVEHLVRGSENLTITAIILKTFYFAPTITVFVTSYNWIKNPKIFQNHIVPLELVIVYCSIIKRFVQTVFSKTRGTFFWVNLLIKQLST